MVERLLIVIALAMMTFAGLTLLQSWQRRRAGRVAPRHDRPTLLYFHSDHCAPCAAQGRFVETVETQFRGSVLVMQIDADVEQDMAASYGVFTLPTTLIVDTAGAVRHANYGLTDARKLARQLHSLGPFSKN